jgi:hypothetical protein
MLPKYSTIPKLFLLVDDRQPTYFTKFEKQKQTGSNFSCLEKFPTNSKNKN